MSSSRIHIDLQCDLSFYKWNFFESKIAYIGFLLSATTKGVVNVAKCKAFLLILSSIYQLALLTTLFTMTLGPVKVNCQHFDPLQGGRNVDLFEKPNFRVLFPIATIAKQKSDICIYNNNLIISRWLYFCRHRAEHRTGRRSTHISGSKDKEDAALDAVAQIRRGDDWVQSYANKLPRYVQGEDTTSTGYHRSCDDWWWNRKHDRAT